jgi:hypothetical protein
MAGAQAAIAEGGGDVSTEEAMAVAMAIAEQTKQEGGPVEGFQTSAVGGSGPEKRVLYMYRAQDDTNHPIENMDVADLPGVLWYLHNEVVTTCPRKYNVTRIRRFRVTLQNTFQLFSGQSGAQWGPYVAFDMGRCTVPNCDMIWQQYGYVVGCQVEPLNLGHYMSDSRTTASCATPDECYAPMWFSLPGPCPSQYYDAKTEECRMRQRGGACLAVNGNEECTFHIEDAGEVRLDTLTGVPGDYTDWCTSGGLEYDKATDTGREFSWWDMKNDRMRCTDRINQVKNAFAAAYPQFPPSLPVYMCDSPPPVVRFG